LFLSLFSPFSSEISGSRGSECGDEVLVGRCPMYSCKNAPMFQKCLPHQSYLYVALTTEAVRIFEKLVSLGHLHSFAYSLSACHG
jgi:hypothetical protein